MPSVHRASVRTIGFVPRHCRKCQALAGASHASPSKGRQGGQAGQGTDPAGPPAGAGRAPDGAEGTPVCLCCRAGLPNLALSQSKAERLGGLIGGDEDAAEQVTVLQMRPQSCRGGGGSHRRHVPRRGTTCCLFCFGQQLRFRGPILPKPPSSGLIWPKAPAPLHGPRTLKAALGWSLPVRERAK